MSGYSIIPDDAVEVQGLSVVLEAEQEPPYLELLLRCGGLRFRAAILAAGEEWTLRVVTEDGEPVDCGGEPYLTQHAAVYAALLAALDASLRPA